MNWTRITKRLVALGIFALSMSLMISCGGGEGGDGGEVVYLYIFNGYAGSQSMSLYGPSGKVVTGLKFGERSDGPVAVDRNLGTTFKLVVDGAPKTIEENYDLFEMYPHETGTLMFKKRSGLSSADTVLYRHVQSVSKDLCRLVFGNGLSLDTAGLGKFGFIPIFKLPKAKDAGYQFNESENRDNIISMIDAEPSFVFVPHWDFPQKLMLVFAGRDMYIDYVSGEIFTHRPTEEYEECIKSAQGDPKAIEVCKDVKKYTTHVYKPTDTVQYAIEYPKGTLDPAAPNSCNVNTRIQSDFDNIFIEDKLLPAEKYNYSPGNHMFWILYGRPVDPAILSFSTDSEGGHYVELPAYPGQ